MSLTITDVTLWAALAFCLWLLGAGLFRRLCVPHAALMAAIVGWVVAGFCRPWVLAMLRRAVALVGRHSFLG